MSEQKIKTNCGDFVKNSEIRFLFTSLYQEKKSIEFKEFEKNTIQYTINILPFSQFSGDLPEIVEFLFARSNRNQLKLENGLEQKLIARVLANSNLATFRSLANAIEKACHSAFLKMRESVVLSDFQNFRWLSNEIAAAPEKNIGQFSIANDDCLGIEPWENLYKIARTGNLADGENLLRQIMIEYASIENDGNMKKIAAQLGVSRQHLYKSSIRRDGKSSKS